MLGEERLGELGNGTTQDSGLPVDTIGVTDATAITVSAVHACALHATGTVSCWGFGTALGNGSLDSSSVPIEVPGLSDVTAIAAGEQHACALIADGTLKC